MMKGLVITTDNRVYPQVFEEPLYKSVGDVVQGWIEVVHPQGLPHPLCLICNEEGLHDSRQPPRKGCCWIWNAMLWPVNGMAAGSTAR